MRRKSKREPQLRPRIRVLRGDVIVLGPGKIDLLVLVGETGSIREAAKRMGASYMRAWSLIQTMNAYFREPLVQAIRGGPEHGGATLTETGQKALKIYQQMEKDFSAATTQRWKELRALLRE